MRSQLLTPMIVAVALGCAACGGGAASVRVVEGTVTGVDVAAEGIGLDNEEGYLIGSGVVWQDTRGSWHSGGVPECLPPLSSGANIVLGVVEVPDDHDAIGQPNHVVWIKCRSLPTEVPVSDVTGLGHYFHFCGQVPEHEVCQ